MKGFTLIEVIVVIILLIVFAGVPLAILNNRGATETRARENAQKFALENNLSIQRLSCAGDSDHDGYGSCIIVTQDQEKIRVKCPTGFLDTKLFGASTCKEVDINLNY